MDLTKQWLLYYSALCCYFSRNANSDLLHGGFQDNGNFITFSGNPTDHWTMPFNGDGAFAGIADNEEDFV